jgi:UDP-glucose 4-epimerase
MKVLVVGGAGYIGSHVVKALLAQKDEVIVFDNLSTGLEQNLFPEAHFQLGDLQDPTVLNATLERWQPEAVIHLAALKAAGESMTEPEKYSTANLNGTVNLLNACSKHHVKYFVFSSSAAVYGSPQYVPMDEKHPKQPENYYGFTKSAIEELFPWYNQLRGMCFASLRYFNAAGYDVDGVLKGLERNPANLLPVVMEVASGMRAKMQLFGDDYETRDGSCIRDYVHVTDLADAHVRAITYLAREGKNLTVNLGSEQGVTVKEMIVAAEKITGKTIHHEIVGRRAGDPAGLVASSAYARETLGWTARHSDVDTLIRSSWEAYQANQKA